MWEERTTTKQPSVTTFVHSIKKNTSSGGCYQNSAYASCSWRSLVIGIAYQFGTDSVSGLASTTVFATSQRGRTKCFRRQYFLVNNRRGIVVFWWRVKTAKCGFSSCAPTYSNEHLRKSSANRTLITLFEKKLHTKNYEYPFLYGIIVQMFFASTL